MTSERRVSSASISDRSNPVTVLSLGCTDEDQASLRDMSRETGWRVVECGDLAQALPLLDARGARVVLCGERVGSSRWQDVLELAAGHDDPPRVIVVARHADEALWAEVLNLGAFDLLESPLDASETTRVIAYAWLHAKLEPRVPVQSDVGAMRATA